MYFFFFKILIFFLHWVTPTPRPQGFDEYMNITVDDAEEVSVKKKQRKPLGMILLKGENVSLICPAK